MLAGKKILLFLFLVVLVACKKEEKDAPKPPTPTPVHEATPYDLDLPFFLPEMFIPDYNPLTVEGVELGRHLFWEKQLSRNGTISCGSCHAPEASFSDPQPFSVGVNGMEGPRHSMALVNLGWVSKFFWDGRANTLEEQILEPVHNPIEMDLPWSEAVARIQQSEIYPPMFSAAFGSPTVDSTKISYAIASFLRTMVSFRSKFDRAYRYGEVQLSPSEIRGQELFLAEGGDPNIVPGGQFGADCFHCHGGEFVFFTDNQFHNNGLDSVFTDLGRGGVTANALDNGRFRTPTLRNIELSAPYMHDGRFATLEEVIEHYDSGGHPSATIDPFMKYTSGGLQLTDQDKEDLINFLKTLTDTEFINNPAFQDPH